MDKTKHDRRARRTEQQLEEALLKLLQTKKITKITVKELADEADITRATFYKHYEDPIHMLSCLQNRMLDEIIRLINNNTGKNPAKFFLELFTYLSGEVLYPEILFINTEEGSGIDRIGKILVHNYMISWQMISPKTDRTEYHYYRTYIVYGVAAIIRNWIADGMKESPEYMTELAVNLLPHSRMNTK